MDFSLFILGVKYFFQIYMYIYLFNISHYFFHSSEDLKEISSNVIT